jgi:hypothetical protein
MIGFFLNFLKIPFKTETAMGQNVDAQNKQNSDYISAVST